MSASPISPQQVPMVAPDGTPGFADPSQMQSLADKGYKPGIRLRAPDGTAGVADLTKLAPLLQKGYKTEGQYQESQGNAKNPPPTSYQQAFNQTYATSPNDNPVMTALKTAGSTIGNTILHPVNTLSASIQSQSGSPYYSSVGSSEVDPSTAQDIKDGGKGYAASKLAGNLAGAAVLGTSTYGLGKALGAGANMVPSTARAGATFDALSTDLANQPVPLKSALEPLQRATELAGRGRTLPTPVKAILERSQAIEPMTYPEARDYQSALSDMSAQDNMSMSNSMKAQVARLGQGFFDDIKAAADAAGKGDDYANAMKEYRQASTLRDSAKAAMKIGLAAGGALKGYNIFKTLTGRQ